MAPFSSRTMPNFIGVGTLKSATTWLHLQLLDHPDVYVPKYRKEIDYFNVNFSRGHKWYEDFFPEAEERDKFKAIGEISPRYLADLSALQRIHDFGVPRVLMILREPVQRAYSEYNHYKRYGSKESFSSIIRDPKHGIMRRSMYSYGVKRCFDLFGRDNVLVLFFEEVKQDNTKALNRVANFLGIDENGFGNSVDTTANRGFVPRFPALTRFVYATDSFLRERNLDVVVEKAKRLGARRVIEMLGRKPNPLSRTDRAYLKKFFAHDIKKLEALLEIEITYWRP